MRKRGRPPNAPENRQSRMISIRLTDLERARIEEWARAKRWSVTATVKWAVTEAMQGYSMDEEAERAKLLGLLLRWWNNDVSVPDSIWDRVRETLGREREK